MSNLSYNSESLSAAAQDEILTVNPNIPLPPPSPPPSKMPRQAAYCPADGTPARGADGEVLEPEPGIEVFAVNVFTGERVPTPPHLAPAAEQELSDDEGPAHKKHRGSSSPQGASGRVKATPEAIANGPARWKMLDFLSKAPAGSQANIIYKKIRFCSPITEEEMEILMQLCRLIGCNVATVIIHIKHAPKRLVVSSLLDFNCSAEQATAAQVKLQDIYKGKTNVFEPFKGTIAFGECISNCVFHMLDLEQLN